MSLSQSIYLGPYAECRYEIADAEVGTKTCSDSLCQLWNTETWAKFCGQCGSPTKVRAKIVSRRIVDRDQIVQEIDERLCVPVPDGDCRNVDLWLANMAVEGHRWHWDDTAYRAIISDDIIGDLGAFREFYAKELDVLRLMYGRDKVEIRWGLIAYRS